MKKLKRLALVLLAIVTCGLGCFAGCNPGGGNDSTDSSSTQAIATTNTYLSKNGYTSYKIVLPETASSTLTFAAEELQYFFNLATDANLTVISEAEVADTKGKYLSIGETKIAEEAAPDYSYEAVGLQGFCVKTHGDAMVMVGGSDKGSLYAVYGFLGLQFDLEIYAE